LFEGEYLFDAVRDGQLNDEQHLAEMVALMGPPPSDFLQRSEKCKQFWDSKGTVLSVSPRITPKRLTSSTGNWICKTPISEMTFESRERRLKGEDKAQLLALIRKILRWLPEERPSAEDLFNTDSFLLQCCQEQDVAS
jgi:hypothetical protein